MKAHKQSKMAVLTAPLKQLTLAKQQLFFLCGQKSCGPDPGHWSVILAIVKPTVTISKVATQQYWLVRGALFDASVPAPSMTTF